MGQTATEKREGGQVKGDAWLVLTESEQQPDGSWKHSCGESLRAVTRHHPVWDGPGLCCGSGEVRTEQVPYCRNCEERPTEQGMPIKE